jgi:hypothetical protein
MPPYLPAIACCGRITLLRAKTDEIMPLVRIWVFDGVLASTVAGVADVFTAANAILAERRGRGPSATPLLK